MLLEGKLSLALGNDGERHFRILRPRSRAGQGQRGGKKGSLQRAITEAKATCSYEVVRRLVAVSCAAGVGFGLLVTLLDLPATRRRLLAKNRDDRTRTRLRPEERTMRRILARLRSDGTRRDGHQNYHLKKDI